MVAIFTSAGAGLERGSGAVLGSAGLLGSASLGRSGQQAMLNAATGNLLIAQRDEFLAGRGIDAAATRTYNSRAEVGDDNGDRWRLGSDRRLFGLIGTTNTAGSSIKRVTGDGSVATYNWNGSAYLSTDGAGAYDHVTFNGTSWAWTDGDSQTVETYGATYNGEHYVTSVTDRGGDAVSYTYGFGDNRLTRATTANGETLDYTWANQNVVLIAATFAHPQTGAVVTQTRTRYAYDSLDRLTSVTVDLTPEDNKITDGRVYVTTYEYEGSSRLISAIGETDGSRLQITYDLQQRVQSIVQIIAAGVSRTTSFSYSTGLTSVTDALGQTTQLAYGANGELTAVTMPPATAGTAAQTTQFSYSSDGSVSSITDALNHQSSFTYDARGNIASATDRLGQTVTRTYGAANELLTETRTASDASGDATLQTVRYAYDSAGRLRFAVSAGGSVSETVYDALGRVQKLLQYISRYDVGALAGGSALDLGTLAAWASGLADRSGHLQQFYYDARGNITLVSDFAINEAGVEDYGNGLKKTHFLYDQSGQLLKRWIEGENSELFAYDGLGRLVASTDLNGGTTVILFRDANAETQVVLHNGLHQVSSYNKAGELLTYRESGSAVAASDTNYTYDALGRVRMVTADGRRTYFIHDAANRRVAEIGHDGQVTEFRWDAEDRPLATIRYATAVAATQLTTLADPAIGVTLADIRPPSATADLYNWRIHDAEGRVIQEIDGAGNVATYGYDAAGRLLKTTESAAALSISQIDAFKSEAPLFPVTIAADADNDRISRNFYDRDGRVLATLDGAGYLVRNRYDARGNVIETIAYAGKTASPLAASGSLNELIVGLASADDRITHNAYDGRGLLVFSVDALGYVTRYIYSGNGGADGTGLVRQTIQFAAPIGTLGNYSVASIQAAVGSQATSSANRSTLAIYDRSARLSFAIDASGTVTQYVYDAEGRVTETRTYVTKFETTTVPSLESMESWSSAYWPEPNNRISRNVYNVKGQLRFSVDAERFVTEYRYDAAGRMTERRQYGTPFPSTITYTGSAVVTQIQIYGYNLSAQFTYQYDSFDRLIAERDGTGVWQTYEYAANGTMTTTVRAAGTSDESRTHFEYDGSGRMIAQHVGYGSPEVAVTRQTWNGFGEIVVIDTPGSGLRTRTYDQRGQLLGEADVLGHGVQYVYDAFGAVTKSTDARGNSSYNYYDEAGRLVATRDAEGYVVETTYTAFSEVAQVIRRAVRLTDIPTIGVPPTVSASAQDAVTQFDHDALGRVIRMTDAEGFYEEYTLDAFGQRIAVRNKLGGTTHNLFDKRGLLIQETLPVGSVDQIDQIWSTAIVNKFEHDFRGNLVLSIEADGLPEQLKTRYIYDQADRLVTRRNAEYYNDVSWGYGYILDHFERNLFDARGNLIQTIDNQGFSNYFFYNDLDQKIAELNALGALTQYSYDAAGNMTRSRIWGTTVPLPAVPGGAVPATPAGDFRETRFDYDAANRLVATVVENVRTGGFTSTGFSIVVQDLATSFERDANGNITRTTNPNGEAVLAYYDALSRKIAEVDAAGYVTTWTYDADGNVLRESRYAAPVVDATSAVIPTVDDADPNNRVTYFTYDRNGRRLTEARDSVAAYAIDASNGQVTGAVSVSTIAYEYNGLGLVTSKTEATGDATRFSYDLVGRLTMEQRAEHAELDNADPVSRTITYNYDGHDNITRMREGLVEVSSTDRVTQYFYNRYGWLTTMTDPTNVTTHYEHDAVGRVVRTRFAREHANGGLKEDHEVFRYDAVGRKIFDGRRSQAANWVSSTGNDTEYNVYGEVSRRGIHGGWQESFRYDAAGRLVASNADDGLWRYYLHDAAGNQTAKIESSGADLRNLSLDAVLTLAIPEGATSLGEVSVPGIAVTLNAFDARGALVATHLEDRELSVGAATVDLVSERGYNAFGELAFEVDASGGRTDYSYNTMGRLLKIERPDAPVIDGDYQTHSNRPTDYILYDVSGRAIGVIDANGNLTTRQLLAGTGYDGSEGLIVTEWRPDGIVRNEYDRFGDLRRATDEINRVTSMRYDARGRMIERARPGHPFETFAYNMRDQRIRYSYLDATQPTPVTIVEMTDYDHFGRVTLQISAANEVTYTFYDWIHDLHTTGLGTFGGWYKQTYTDDYKTFRDDRSDMYGREIRTYDYGKRYTDYNYDLAGRVISRAGVGETQSFTWLNTGLLGEQRSDLGSGSTRMVERFGYDMVGNRTSEWGARDGVVYQDTTATYDGLNRLSTLEAAATSIAPAMTMAWSYDAVGNIRRTSAVRASISALGTVGPAVTENRLYQFDSMNRVVWDGNAAVLYDAAGQRVRSSRYEQRYVQVADPASVYEAAQTGNPSAIIYYNVGYTAEIVDHYSYDAAGNLIGVYVAESSASDNGDGTITVYDAPATGALRGSFTYDTLNRLVRQEDRDAAGTVVYDRQVTYDARSRVLSEEVSQREGSATVVSRSVYNYTIYGERMGAVRQIVTNTWRDGVAQGETLTDYHYRMNSGPVLDDTWSRNAAGTWHLTDYQFGPGDRLEQIVLNGPGARTVTVTSDMAGQVLRRSEDVTTAGGDVHDVYYRFAGREIGHVGSRATLGGDYAGSVAERTRAIPTTPSGRADTRHGAGLTRALDPITSFSQGGAGGTYAARAGDTLASIAAGLWGDASLWYKLAQANGMGADDALATGRILRVPAGVTRSTYNADTFRAYDPADAIGDLGALAAPAPRGQRNKCGAFGQILLVAVAVAVSIALPGSGLVAGAVNGAIGSAVSQGVGLATGIQDKFSFKGVALAAIGGGISGGLGDLAKAAEAGRISGNLAKAAKFVGGSGVLSGATRGVIASVAGQGVGLATGLQSRFDFAGVATAGVIGGIGNAASRAIGGKPASFGNQFGSSGASALAGAAARSLLTGTSFGDNVLAVLPDVVGSAIGRAVGGALRGNGTGRLQHRSDQAMLEEIFAREGSNQLVGPVDLSRLSLDPLALSTGFAPSAGDALNSLNAVGQVRTAAGSTSAAAERLRATEHLVPATRAQNQARWNTYRADMLARPGVRADDAENLRSFLWHDQQFAAEELSGTLRADAAVAELATDIGKEWIKTAAFEVAGVGAAKLAAPVLGAIGGTILRIGERPIARAVRLGHEGERAAGIVGAKSGIQINGRMRFPDEVTDTLVKEVKNVARQGWTRQLKDYAQLAKDKRVPFELWVRGSRHALGKTDLSTPLKAAIQRGDVVLRTFK